MVECQNMNESVRTKNEHQEVASINLRYGETKTSTSRYRTTSRATGRHVIAASVSLPSHRSYESGRRGQPLGLNWRK